MVSLARVPRHRYLESPTRGDRDLENTIANRSLSVGTSIFGVTSMQDVNDSNCASASNEASHEISIKADTTACLYAEDVNQTPEVYPMRSLFDILSLIAGETPL